MADSALPIGLAQTLDLLTRAIAIIGFCGLVGMALLIFYDGGARYLGAPRVNGFSDYGEVVFPIVIASCFPAGLLRQTNVTVRILGKLGGFRLHAMLEAFAAVVTLAFFAVLVWQFFNLTANYSGAGRTTRTIGIPLGPWWWATTAIMALCIPVQAYVGYCWVKAAISGHSPSLSALADQDEMGKIE